MSARSSFFAALFASCTAIAWCGVVAHAAPIPVTTTTDGTGGTDCTLRDAISAANTNMAVGGCPAGIGADTIDLSALAGTILLASPLPNVASDVSIEGPGASSLIGRQPDPRNRWDVQHRRPRRRAMSSARMRCACRRSGSGSACRRPRSSCRERSVARGKRSEAARS